jgi:hypothetical protein
VPLLSCACRGCRAGTKVEACHAGGQFFVRLAAFLSSPDHRWQSEGGLTETWMITPCN